MQGMPADWNDLRYFVAIRRAGTLAGAGRLLGVDQTTVGRRLAALEEALDARLFDRTPDGMALTAAGDAIFANAEQIEANVTDLERKIAGEDLRLEGTVRVAASDAFATGFLLPRFAQLRTKLSDVLIEIVTSASVIDLARREADIAIRMRPPGTQPGQLDLVARKIGELGFYLFGSRGYLAKRKKPRRGDLAGHDLVAYDDDLPPIPGAVWLRDPARGGRIVVRCQTIPQMAAAAAAGAGLAVLPAFVADRSNLERAASAAIDRATIWLVAHPDLLRTARVRAVLDALAEIMLADAAILRG
jgi:DNA-binding transcriptional LysR family regulator